MKDHIGFLFLVVLWLGIPVAVVIREFVQLESASQFPFPWLAIPFAAVSLIVAAFNFCLSFVRPLVFRLAHGSMDGFRWASGIPGVGTICLLLALAPASGNSLIGCFLLVSYTLDTAGLGWFVPCQIADIFRR